MLKRKYDYAVIAITLVYACIVFYKIGAFEAPVTYWNSTDTVCIDLGQEQWIDEIKVWLGNIDSREFIIRYCDNENKLISVDNEMINGVFRWSTITANETVRYVYITPQHSTIEIGELVVISGADKLIPISVSSGAEVLFDEQDLYTTLSETPFSQMYWDEGHFAGTAYEQFMQLNSSEITHPPLGKTLIAVGIMLFGMTPFGWRLIPALAGIIAVPVFYLLAKKLTNEHSAFLATVLFCVDFMHLVQSRMGTVDMLLVLWILLSWYAVLQWLNNEQMIYLVATAIFAGLAIGCKWSGCFSLVGILVVVFIKKKLNIKTLGCLIVIPLLIYTLGYIPFLDNTSDNFIMRMLNNQLDIWGHHSINNTVYETSSRWWEWLLDRTPLWFQFSAGERIGMIVCWGNPAIWIMSAPTILAGFKNYKEPAVRLLLTIILANYLPWAVVTRSTFIYHFFPAVTFVILLIGKLMEKRPKLFVIYTVFCSYLFVLMYPMMIGVLR